MLKSIAVVVGSYILSVVLVVCSDPLLSKIFPGDFIQAKGHVPSNQSLIASTVCFVIASIIAAAVCARLAPRSVAKHVFWLFVIGEALGIGMTIPQWNGGWPHWYFLSWFLTWPISCWLGLKLGGRAAQTTAATA